MADDFTFKDAAGVTRTGKSDQIGGADYPYVKIADGTDGETTPLAVTAEGALAKLGAPMRYATEARSTVSADNAWAVEIAANATRRALTLYNASANVVLVSFGDTSLAELTVPKFALAAGAFYEMPATAIYTGAISMYAAAGASDVHVGEAS